MGRNTNIDAFTGTSAGLKPIPGLDTPSARDLRLQVHGPRPATGRELQDLAKGRAPTHYVLHYGRRVEGVIISHRFVGGYDSYETAGYGCRVSVICEPWRAVALSCAADFAAGSVDREVDFAHSSPCPLTVVSGGSSTPAAGAAHV